MACPHISGTAALILRARNINTPEKVRQDLLDESSRDELTGLRAGNINRLLYVGAGEAPTPVPTPAPPPGCWTVTGSDCTLTEDDNCIQSKYDPGSYGNNEECTMRMAEIALTAEIFNTENRHDLMTMSDGTA